jgi:hypothetical protein
VVIGSSTVNVMLPSFLHGPDRPRGGEGTTVNVMLPSFLHGPDRPRRGERKGREGDSEQG